MTIKDPLTGHPMRAFSGDWQQELDRLRAAMAATLLDGPSLTSHQLTDYSDDPEYAIPPRDVPAGRDLLSSLPEERMT